MIRRRVFGADQREMRGDQLGRKQPRPHSRDAPLRVGSVAGEGVVPLWVNPNTHETLPEEWARSLEKAL